MMSGSMLIKPQVSSLRSAFTGPHDIGRGRPAWILMAAILLGLMVYPTMASAFSATNVAYYLLNIPMALGLSLLWGYGGILSFGQVAFFAVAGYVYGIVAGNMSGDPTLGSILGVVAGLGAAGFLALIFGYFIFYARVAAWIVPILTLVLALLLSTFLGLTAGSAWKVGEVALGGYNGMNIPSFQIGGFVFQDYAFYYLSVTVVVLCFVALRIRVNSHRGQVLIALREDPLRTELLGYDVRLEQLLAFIIAAILSGISGLLYVTWGNYITPSVTSLAQAALPVIWVAVGGRDSLFAVVILTFLLNQLTYVLSSAGNQYALIITGVLLVLVMLFAPEGLIPRLILLGRKVLTRKEAA